LFSKVQADPQRTLDSTYREHNQEMSGTAYRHPNWPPSKIAFRPIFVECTNRSLSREEQRARDQAPRSFWGVRNHLGKYETNYLGKVTRDHEKAKQAAEAAGITQYNKPCRAWLPKPANPAVGLPKQDGTFAACPPQGIWQAWPRELRFRDWHTYPHETVFHESRKGEMEKLNSTFGEMGVEPMVSAREQYEESRRQ